MIVAFIAVGFGLALLVWSADRFVSGASAAAGYFGMPPLLIGMVVVGFGTSAPEMVVSALAALQGNPGLALGNAYGSNISNIALILGLTALIKPIAVHSQVLRKELPILTVVTLLAGWQVWDGQIGRKTDALAADVAQELEGQTMSLRRAVTWLVIGLVLLIASSRLLVWGAVALARGAGVSDLVIGLTIVAIGTSLPELASSVIATRKGEHDLALGNVLGSNLFNTLAVVGIAGTIRPMVFGGEVFTRDLPVMTALTVSLFLLGYGFRGRPGRINRLEGALLLICFAGYTSYLLFSVFGG